MLKIDASSGERKNGTQHRRVKASLHIAAQAKGLNQFQLPFSHTAFILSISEDSLQTACTQCLRLSGYSHYPPPQPLAKLSPNALSPIIQQASNINKCIKAVAGGCSQFCVSRCIRCYPQNVASAICDDNVLFCLQDSPIYSTKNRFSYTSWNCTRKTTSFALK